MNSHVVPALIRRFHESKIKDEPLVEIWGTGTPRREFLFSDDLASACVRVMKLNTEKYLEILGDGVTHLNIGTGIDLEIKELAVLIKEIVGYSGEIVFDDTKPDGTPRKLLDISRLQKIDWVPSVSLKQGVGLAYDDFLKSKNIEYAPKGDRHEA
jgi:GDP-L-fucose synthase